MWPTFAEGTSAKIAVKHSVPLISNECEFFNSEITLALAMAIGARLSPISKRNIPAALRMGKNTSVAIFETSV